jgi:glycosidase
LYDTLKHILQGQGSTDHLPDIWQFLRGKNKNMLRFLENHDEQRIASRFFVGDPRKAMPGMVVTALWHTGPVMVYSGQEVGEPALGESGFSGDDGRTTIFDYWGVPGHQKWVNEGAYDGGQLNTSQNSLRDFYVKLLHLSREKAFSQGYFYDLHPHNRRFTEGYTDKVYAFLRFKEDQQFIIVSNFDAENAAVFNLKIPHTVLQAMGLPEEQLYQASDQLLSEQTVWFEGSHVVISEGNYGIPVILQPLESCVFIISMAEKL